MAGLVSGWGGVSYAAEKILNVGVTEEGPGVRRPQLDVLPGLALSESALEELADGSGGLADALFVFHQGEADVAFAEGAEPNSRGDGDRRLLKDELGEFQGAGGAVFFGDRRPQEHRAARFFHRPAGAIQAIHQNLGALLVVGADLFGVLFALA